jgi:hypothetical protein
MKTLLSVGFILFISIALGQGAEAETCDSLLQVYKDSLSGASSESNMTKQINDMKEDLQKKVSINQAAFCFAQPITHVHKAEKIGGKEDVTIETISINTYAGRIQKILVTIEGDNGYFINKGPISVTTIKSFKGAKLYYEGGTENLKTTWLIIGDVINYIDYTNRASYPSDYSMVLSKEKFVDSIKIDKSPLEFFDVRAYSDAKGLSGEANGLAQTDINVSFIGNTKSGKSSFWSYVTPFAYVNMNLTLSKFDSDFDTLEIASFGSRSDIDVLKFMQYSNVSFKVETELFRYSRIHDGFLTVGHQLYSTVLRDTTNMSKRVLTPSFYFTLGGTMFSLPKIKGTYKFPVLFNYLNDQPFSGAERNLYMCIIPEIEIVVDPIQKDGEGNAGVTLFGRIRYFDLPNYKGNNFWQLQLGASIPLTSVFD